MVRRKSEAVAGRRERDNQQDAAAQEERCDQVEQQVDRKRPRRKKYDLQGTAGANRPSRRWRNSSVQARLRVPPSRELRGNRGHLHRTIGGKAVRHGGTEIDLRRATLPRPHPRQGIRMDQPRTRLSAPRAGAARRRGIGSQASRPAHPGRAGGPRPRLEAQPAVRLFKDGR